MADIPDEPVSLDRRTMGSRYGFSQAAPLRRCARLRWGNQPRAPRQPGFRLVQQCLKTMPIAEFR